MRHEGLLPQPVDLGNGRIRQETSVYRASGVTSAGLWAICAEHVDNHATQMKARGTAEAVAFLEKNLSFDADGNPHPRHANVIGWPEEKHARKNLAREIADRMTLEVRPDSSNQEP